jgi:hypothetical protein
VLSICGRQTNSGVGAMARVLESWRLGALCTQPNKRCGQVATDRPGSGAKRALRKFFGISMPFA